MHIDDRLVTALFDTGAMVPVMSEKLFNSFQDKLKLNCIVGKVISASRTYLGYHGSIQLKLRIGKHHFVNEVCVLSNLQSDSILVLQWQRDYCIGMEWMKN